MQIFQESMSVKQSTCELENSTEIRTRAEDPEHSENAVIAARLSAHDPAIIDELVSRYQARLRRYLIRLTSDRELAEDVLQETWIRVLTRGSQFKGESQFTTWLYTIARNLVRDLRRRGQPHIGSLEITTNEGDPVMLDAASKEKTPFEHYASLEKEHIFAGVLRTLMPHHREVLELRFYQEMSLNEIALTIGAPISTVKARLYRAIVTLRSKMREVSAQLETFQFAL